MKLRVPTIVRRFLTAAVVVSLAGVVAGVALLAWHRLAPRRTPAGQPELVRLRDDPQPLREAFNRASNSHRLLVLLSPT